MGLSRPGRARWHGSVALLAATVALSVSACGGSSSTGSPPSSSTSGSASSTAPSPSSSSTTSRASGSSSSSGGSSSASVSEGAHVFASAGCGACHTLAAAHSSGSEGPNLNQLKPTDSEVVAQVTAGGGAMPSYSGRLSKAQIDAVAKFVASATH